MEPDEDRAAAPMLPQPLPAPAPLPPPEDAPEPIPAPVPGPVPGPEPLPDTGSHSRTRQYIAALAVSMGAMAAGCELAWTSPALPQLKSNETTQLREPLGEMQSAWVGALLAVGALVGALPGGFLADRYGRRLVLAAISAPFLVSWITVFLATRASSLYIARFLAGLATGAVSVVAPVYVGEVAEPEIRGALGSGFQLFITVGILYAYACGALVGTKALAALCALPPLLLLLGALLLAPESPSFLVRKGDEAGARRSLRVLLGEGADVERPLQLLREEAAQEGGSEGKGLRELVATTARRKALLISLGLMACQQLSGINAVIFYCQDIFRAAGSTIPDDVSACIVGVVQVLATLAAASLVDRAGRRPLLLLSAALMAACQATLGLCFKLPDSMPGWLSLLAVGVFIVAFSLGCGPLPWMMLGEIFAPEVKGTASGLAVTLNWVIVFAVTFAFPPAAAQLGGYAVFWFFAVVCGAGVAFVLLVVPETKGKTLQEIQDALSGEKPGGGKRGRGGTRPV